MNKNEINMNKFSEATLPVLEMTCAVCSSNVEKAVSGLKGVYAATVNFASATLYIKYNPNEITLQQIREQCGVPVTIWL